MLKTKKRTLKFGSSHREIEVGDVINLAVKTPLKLDCGEEISDFPIAFQTYGKLNKSKSNAILICHALTGDQYVVGKHPVTKKNGWWSDYVGKGKAIDTDKYFIICPNALGGCMGSFGPKDEFGKTGKPYGLDFPVITIGDMVKVQKLLVEAFGIKKLHSVIGGSMGGMQVLEWISKYPKLMNSAVAIATSAKHSAQNIAFNEIGRQAVMADAGWCKGKYTEMNQYPDRGLAIARMMAHITYLSEAGLQNKFGRKLQNKSAISFGFDADFQVESYLRYQGMSFVERFDANSYLYITRAMDYFDLASDFGGSLAKAFEKTSCRVCVISFNSDWLFPTSASLDIVRALSASSSDVSFFEIESDKGHDSFLLPNTQLEGAITGFLAR
jgi:homoserine O-acetyltransferase